MVDVGERNGWKGGCEASVGGGGERGTYPPIRTPKADSHTFFLLDNV